MRVTTLDTIVKGMLIKQQRPRHYYMQFLFLAARGLEEITFDSLPVIKTVKLKADEFYSIQLPCDVMSVIKVGVPHGQFVRPLFQRDGINSLYNYDDQDNKVLYPADTFEISAFDTMFFTNMSVFGFDVRGMKFFGLGSNNDTQSFKYIPEDNRIQLNQRVGTDTVIVQYMTDGCSADNATMVDPMAKDSIETYVNWQYKESTRSYGEGERERAKRLFQSAHAKLRARKNNLKKADIIALFRQAAKGSPKI